jgi:peptidoglycan/xylan/chitin deacetylase (PgdA/CDA1 family)
MYLGSVRFFKHLIYMTMAFFIWAVALGLYFFGNFIIIGLAENTQASPVGEQPEMILEDIPDHSVDLSDAWEFSSNVSTPAFTPIDYQLKYPVLYSEIPAEFADEKKVAYLTFDDGPSARTLEILSILREEDVKATFFVVTQDADADILRRIAEEGHSIGIHTNSHKYKEIYASVEDYLDDFQAAYETIYEATSIKPEVFRFPGGSINAYNRSIYQELIAEMLRRGFLYYDWNISCMDVDPNITPDRIIDSIKSAVRGQTRPDKCGIKFENGVNQHDGTVEYCFELVGLFDIVPRDVAAKGGPAPDTVKHDCLKGPACP